MNGSKKMYKTIYIGLGTNLGDKELNLQKAIEALTKELQKPLRISSIYYSKPWGFISSKPFLNLVASFRTTLEPFQVLDICLELEKKLGKRKKTKVGYESRLIDIDILLFGDLIINNAGLKIPHPLMEERLFVLEPLLEICEDSKKKIKYRASLKRLKNQESLKKINKSEHFP